jgi:hypothetical protein
MKQLTYLCHFLVTILLSSCAFMGGEIPDYPQSEFKTFTLKWYGTMPAYTQLQGNSPCYGIRNPCSENFDAYIKYTSLPYGRSNLSYYINDRLVRSFEIFSSDDHLGAPYWNSRHPFSYEDEYGNIIYFSWFFDQNTLPNRFTIIPLFPFSFDQLPEFKTGVWNLFLPA